MGRDLVILGIAFLLAGLLARAGRRFGLPTIPLFMVAGIIVGPNTPGPVLFDHPEELELLAAFGLIFLLFYLGVEFSIDDLTSGGPQAAGLGRALPGPQHRGRAGARLRHRLGGEGGADHRRGDRHLVVGDRHQAARRAATAGQPRDAADPRHHRARGLLPRPLPRGAGARARPGRRRRRGRAALRAGVRLPDRPRPAGPVRDEDRRARDLGPRRRAARRPVRRVRVPRRRRRRAARRVRRDRGVHGRPRAGRDGGGQTHRAAGPARCATRSPPSSSSPSGCRSTPATSAR